MIARRDRHHKKRRPKQYPPTNIKTRSMEHRETIDSSDRILDWEYYSDLCANSSEWPESGSPELQLLD
jgi:hypothetical protein